MWFRGLVGVQEGDGIRGSVAFRGRGDVDKGQKQAKARRCRYCSKKACEGEEEAAKQEIE